MKPQIAMSEQEWRSLAMSPCPPKEVFPGDCRMGGSSAIYGGFGETRHSRWVIARFRHLKEQKRMERAA